MSDKFGFLGGKQRIFFCGIGGVSMSGLAAICAKNGLTVIGSDCAVSEETYSLLQKYGIHIFREHDEKNISGAEVFVYTAAVKDSNPELIAARKAGIEIYTRSAFLGKFAQGFPHSVAVAGTHGKSTVTDMIGSVFSDYDPQTAVLVGAADKKTGLSFRDGSSRLVFEACEYSRSFLDFHPECSVILNIEREHTDTYPTLKSALESFSLFALQSKTCLIDRDCENTRKIIPLLENCGIKTLTFSLSDKSADVYAKNITSSRGFYSFTGCFKSEDAFECALQIPGLHTVSNSLAAALCARYYGLDTLSISKSLQNFHGLKRRFEFLGRLNGADIFDDYAHHPTEIRATLKTARSLGYKRIICAFQPHTYSRTFSLFRSFTAAFTDCDLVVFADIFPAREVNIYGISSEMLASSTENAIYIPSFQGIYSFLAENAQDGTMIITMGAGKLNEISSALAHTED